MGKSSMELKVRPKMLMVAKPAGQPMMAHDFVGLAQGCDHTQKGDLEDA